VLLALLDAADLIVAPSRCEGFGMMLLAAVVAGVPLVCTYATGQSDFLAESRGWVGFPTSHSALLAGEEGMAPRVESGVLAQTLSMALRPEARQALLSPLLRDENDEPDWGTWTVAAPQWADRLEDWMKETA
jgi:glycosyltransferase involved in cell wall biosynthesis